ncbi:PAS domain-containing protein [Sphingomonas sp. Tas61C01]|uniref:PAS domain-containing protein n=1 Tax=Sphingomonas sp. Tas61C01 TaxID=3458297 RepID=UPI00403EF3E5
MTSGPANLSEIIVQSGRGPICAFDHDFRLIAFNQAHSDEFFRIYAYRVKIGDVFPDLFLPDQAPIIRGFMARALAGEIFSVVEEFGDPDMARPYWEIHYAPLREADGAIIGAFHHAQDISARLRAEAALAETRNVLRASQRMEAVVAQAAAGIANLDAVGNFTFVNDRYCEMLGRPREELLRLRIQDLTSVTDVGRDVADIAALVEGGPSFESERRFRRPDGSEVWIRNGVSAIRGPDGQLDSILAVAFDVTERRGLEDELARARDTLEGEIATRTAQLRASQDRLRSIFETSFGFQALMDADGVLLDANATSLATIDASLDEVVGRRFWNTPWFAATPGMSDAVQAGVKSAAGGDIFRRSIHVDLPVGGWRWYDFAMRPITDQAGNVVTIVAEAIETTRRRIAEEALRQSQKLEAMGQLTGGVAHDFNNLLTPIIGALDMLQRRGVGGDREHRLIDGAMQAADRAKTLVQRLLAFARRQPLRSTAVDLSALVGSMAGLMASTLGPKIAVNVEVPADTPAAQADAHQLEMAILNLGVNAGDAMPDGGVLTISAHLETVTARHFAGLAPGVYLRLRVADTGAGMSAEVRTRAVEPFYSTKGIGKGTGLGLSMVHGLVAQLGGAMAIDSAPDEGTRVDLWLPASAQPAPRSARPVETLPLIRTRGIALLVDDEELVRTSTADMLVQLGYDVIEAPSAEDALTIIQGGRRIDLLVTDHLMAGISGAELARILRDIRPDLPILIVSGYAEVAEMAPDVPRLAKPFRQADLAASVAALAPA